MKIDTRARMITGATRLLAERGLQETSFSEVLALTGTPRGSVYYHFPKGKMQLVAAAMEAAGTSAIELINEAAGQTAVDVTKHFLAMWRSLLVEADFRTGCAVLAVTVATESDALIETASTVFRTWRVRLAELFEEGGVRASEAGSLAALVIAGAEGAVVLSRADRQIEVFDEVTEGLVTAVQAAETRYKASTVTSLS